MKCLNLETPPLGATAEYSTLSSLTKECPNPNYPNPNVHKQDLNSSLKAVCLCGLYTAVAQLQHIKCIGA